MVYSKKYYYPGSRLFAYPQGLPHLRILVDIVNDLHNGLVEVVHSADVCTQLV